nr:hypothetical protein [Tanacetum cinerariifolium]
MTRRARDKIEIDTSEGSENSRSFEDSRRLDEEYFKDGASSKKGGSETPQGGTDRGVKKPDLTPIKPIRVGLRGDVHQVGDEREVEVLRSFNWTQSELITEDGVLPEEGYSQFNDVVQAQVNPNSTIAQVEPAEGALIGMIGSLNISPYSIEFQPPTNGSYVIKFYCMSLYLRVETRYIGLCSHSDKQKEVKKLIKEEGEDNNKGRIIMVGWNASLI